MTDQLPKPTGLSKPTVPSGDDDFFNQDFSRYGMPEKNLEIGGKDIAVGLAGSTMKALGTGIAETSMGGLARGARAIADGTLAKGIADSVAEKVNPDGTGLLDGMVSFSSEIQDAQKSDPVGGAASTVGNAIGDAAEWVGDKADKVIQPATKTIGSALKSGGESVIKNGTSADYQEAVGRELYTGNSLSTLKLGSSAGDAAVWAAKMVDGIGSIGGTVAAGALTGGTVSSLVKRQMLKRGASEELASETARLAGIKWGQRGAVAAGVNMSTGQAAEQARAQVNALSWDQLTKSQTFMDQARQIAADPEFSGKSATEILDEAKRRTGDHAASIAMSDPKTWAAAAAGTVLGDANLFKMLQGVGAKGAIKGLVQGAAGEATGEAIEEGTQQYVGNEATNKAGGQQIDPWDGVAQAAATAGTIGAFTGGMTGTIGGARGRYAPQDDGSSSAGQQQDQSARAENAEAWDRGLPSKHRKDYSNVPPDVSDIPDLQTARKQMAGESMPGAFALATDQGNYRGVYVDSNGKLSETALYATREDALTAMRQNPTFWTDEQRQENAAKNAQEIEALRAKKRNGQSWGSGSPSSKPEGYGSSQPIQAQGQDAMDTPAFLRQDGTADRFKGWAEDSEVQRALAGDFGPSVAELVKRQVEQGDQGPTPQEKPIVDAMNAPLGLPHKDVIFAGDANAKRPGTEVAAPGAFDDKQAGPGPQFRGAERTRWKDGQDGDVLPPEAGSNPAGALPGRVIEGEAREVGTELPYRDVVYGRDGRPEQQAAAAREQAIAAQNEQLKSAPPAISQSDTIFAAGAPGADNKNNAYTPPRLSRDQIDTSLGEQSIRDPRTDAGQAIQQAGSEADAIFGQLKTLRITKRGKPFASQKEAQLASRKTETPIELPTGGFGVVDKTELEQAIAEQGDVSSPANNTIALDVGEVKRHNGQIGNQGVSESQIIPLLNNVAGLSLPESATMRQAVDALKSDKTAQAKLREFTAANPIQAWEMPDGSISIQDGHHRAFLLDQLGDKTIPANIKDYTGPSQTYQPQENAGATQPVNQEPVKQPSSNAEQLGQSAEPTAPVINEGTKPPEADNAAMPQQLPETDPVQQQTRESSMPPTDGVAPEQNTAPAPEAGVSVSGEKSVAPTEETPQVPWSEIQDRKDGTAKLVGDTKQLMQWSKDNDIKAVASTNGVMVAKPHVAKVKQMAATPVEAQKAADNRRREQEAVGSDYPELNELVAVYGKTTPSVTETRKAAESRVKVSNAIKAAKGLDESYRFDKLIDSNWQSDRDQALSLAKEVYSVESEQELSSVAPTDSKTKIADFGQKIGGARKDVWSSYRDSLEGSTAEQIAELPLSKAWPAPDYQKMIDSGVDARAVGLMRAAREAIPSKPRNSYKVKSWASAVKDLRDLSMQLLDGSLETKSAWHAMSRSSLRGTRNLLNKADLYQAVGHQRSLADLTLEDGEYSMKDGVHYSPPKKIWSMSREGSSTAFGNWPRMFITGDTKEQVIAEFKQRYEQLTGEKAEKKAVTFDIYSNDRRASWVVGKKVGRNYIPLSKPFENVADARRYREENHDALVAELEKRKAIPNERRDINQPRVGEDMRSGADVTPEMFTNAFGFRGVEFGNWVGNERRQRDLNDAYDALMDMAAVLGIHPKALSLNGELGMAFGARGSGGVTPAAAHYEPGKVVINLTKMNGAGSLGHEWWHALDNYFSRQRGAKDGMMTTARDVSLASRGLKFILQGGRQEMIEAFGAVKQAIDKTALKARSSKLDSKRTKDYWTTDVEMSARAFESYLISKLQDQGVSNDYLANIIDEETWDSASKLGFELDSSYPYPTAGEIPGIRAGFDHLFNTIEEKVDGDKVALFSKSDSKPGTKGMDKADIEQVAKEWLEQYKGAAGVRVLVGNNQDEINEVLQMVGADIPGDGQTINAVYLPGYKTLLLNAEAIPTANRARELMRHDVLVHHGLRAVVGDDLYITILEAVKRGERIAGIKDAYYQVASNYADMHQDVQAEEVFSHWAEKQPDRGELAIWWRGVVRKVKDALRAVGLLGPKTTEDEFNRVLDAIVTGMRNGRKPSRRVMESLNEAPAYSKNDGALFSLSGATADQSLMGQAESLAKAAPSTALNWLKEMRPRGLGALTDLQIDQIYLEITGGAISMYQKLRTKMEADRNEILLDAETRIDPLWDALGKEQKKALSNLMHDATMAKLHPDLSLADNSLYQEAKERLDKAIKPETKAKYQSELDTITANHKHLAERYNLGLNREGKALYQTMRETYDKQWADLRDAIEQRLEDLMGAEGKTLAAELRLQMESALKHGPYFPLARFGDYVVKATMGDEHIREHFERRKDAEQAIKQYQRDGYNAVMTVKEAGTGGQANSNALGMKVMQLLDEADSNGGSASSIKDDVWQAMLQMLPDASFAKHAIHRRRVKGASRDGHRAYLNSVYHYAHHVSKIRYGHKMQGELNKMNEQIQAGVKGEQSNIKPEDLEVAQQLLNEMNMRHELNMNPNGSVLSGRLGALGFMWYMAGSPASAIINMTQNFTVMLPQLGAKYGFIKAGKYMVKAMFDYVKHGKFKAGTKEAWQSLTRAESGLTADEKAMLNTLYKAGVLDLTQAHSIAARADTDLQEVKPGAAWQRKTMAWAGSLFHNAEVLNREVAALAAYRLLKEQSPNLTAEQYADQVTEMVYDGHGNYAASNRPRYMRGNVAKVMTQFKIYSQMMTYTLYRNAYLAAKGDRVALKTLGGILGTHFVMAGVMGLPYPVTMAVYAIASAFDDDDDREGEASFRLGLTEVLGKDLGELIARGPMDAMTGLSIAGRTGINDLWYRDPKEGTEGDDLAWHITQQIAGPVLGIGVQAARGLSMMGDGDYQRGAETMMPKALKDVAKAYRQASEGERTHKGDIIIDDVDAFNVAMQVMGFSNAEMAKAYDARKYIKGKEGRIEDERSRLLSDYFMARKGGDEDEMAEVMARIREFNNTHHRKETITGRTLRQSIKSKIRSGDRTQGGVYLSKKREYLRAEGAFADAGE